VRFDELDFHAAVAANRVISLDDIIKDDQYTFRAARLCSTDGSGSASWASPRMRALSRWQSPTSGRVVPCWTHTSQISASSLAIG